jgi:hypothetical protein
VVSSIAAVLLAKAQRRPELFTSHSQQLSDLRDELCDISDALSAIGVQVPLTVLIQCDVQTYESWHKLAGDQSWIRGTFSVEPFVETMHSVVDIIDMSHYARLLTDAASTHASKYKLKTLENSAYLETIAERLKGEKNELTRSMVRRVLTTFSEGSLLTVGDAVGQSAVFNALRRWIDEDVAAKASMNTGTSDAKETGTSSEGKE